MSGIKLRVFLGKVKDGMAGQAWKGLVLGNSHAWESIFPTDHKDKSENKGGVLLG